jgi:hypothetical protein
MIFQGRIAILTAFELSKLLIFIYLRVADQFI